MALTKVSGNLIQQQNFSVGVVTATSFTGDLTGNITGNVTGDVTGDLTGNVTGNVSSSGANTLGSLTVTNDATVGGALTVTGNLTVNGTTTTIDTVVTAIDTLAVDGDVTAGGNLNITGVSTFADKVHLLDNDRLHFGGTAGQDGDLQIGHVSNVSTINDVGSGGLYVQSNGDGIFLRKYGGEKMGEFFTDGAVELYHDNSKKFETTGFGVTVAGGVYVSGVSTFQGNVDLGDNDRLRFGDGNDLQIWHDATSSIISDTGTGSLVIRATNLSLQAANADNYAYFTADGGATLWYDNSQKFETTNSGVVVTGIVTAIGTANSITVNPDLEYPSIRPTLDLNFAATKTLDRRITFTRDSLGTYTDELGIVRTAPNNTPRFDHDPVTGESLGLLIEESRTNYCTSSVDLSDSSWGGTGSYGIDNAITNPDGSVGAYYHTGLELYHFMDLSGASTNEITVSTWVKERSGQSDSLHIQIYQQITGSIINLNVFAFNPATATLDTSDANFSDGKVVEYPNGWYRISVKVTTDSGNFSSSTRIDFQNSEHYVWGTQVEVGAFPTSYIPTSGSTVTRAVDTAVIKGTNFSSWYNASESTIFFESGIAPTNNSKYFTFYGSDGGGTELIESAAVSGPGANIFTYADSTVYSNTSVTDASATKLKFAAGIKLNDVNLAVNGILGTTDTSATNPDAINQLIIGNYSSGSYYANTTIKKLSYYNKRLPNAQLQGLTAQ